MENTNNFGFPFPPPIPPSWDVEPPAAPAIPPAAIATNNKVEKNPAEDFHIVEESLEDRAQRISQLGLVDKLKQSAKLMLDEEFKSLPENRQLEILISCKLNRQEIAYIVNNHPSSSSLNRFLISKIDDQLKLIKNKTPLHTAVNWFIKAHTGGMVNIDRLQRKYDTWAALPQDTVKKWD